MMHGRLVAAAALGLAAFAANAQALTDCRVAGLRNSVRCGVVQRALDPARPAGPRIAVHYVVVPAMARRKLPDPVFLIAGGPGQSAIDVAPQVMPLFSRLNNRRDIVFVDQRGTGESAPLDCPEVRRETLAEQADSAAQIDLVGVSYGTRAVLAYMRQFPTAVRRAVLDSVAPPDMVLPTSFSTDGQAAFDALLAACEREPGCAKAYPKLRADWAALLGGLPKPAAAPHPLSGTTERFTLTREMVLGAVRGALYNPAMAAALPAAISEAAAGRYEGLVGMGSLLGSRRGLRLSTGMHFSVVCAEDMPRVGQASDTPGADFGNAQAQLYQRVCAEWPRGAVPKAFYTVPPSRTPVLLLSGGLDPATPPRHGARIATALGPAAQHVIVANAGHSVLGVGCARDVLYRFIDAADDKGASGVDAGCLKAIPRPGVFRPIDLATDLDTGAAK